jgi:hypothetical protein
MERVGSIKIKAEVIFNSNAVNSFRFPIQNAVRMSLWEKDRRYSTPSETASDTIINLNTPTEVTILFPSDYLDRVLLKGDKFYLGTFPIAIGEATVLEVLRQP